MRTLIRIWGLCGLLFALVSSNSLAQGGNLPLANQEWIQVAQQWRWQEKWALASDAIFRWNQGFEEATGYLLRSELRYRLNKTLQLSGGIAHLGFFSDAQLDQIEVRPHQAILYRKRHRKLALTQRIRVEERFFGEMQAGKLTGETHFNWRFRYLLSLNLPLLEIKKLSSEAKLSCNLGNEILFRVGSGMGSRPFEQNRLLIGPALRINQQWAVSFIYQGRLSQRLLVPDPYHVTHIFWVKIQQHL